MFFRNQGFLWLTSIVVWYCADVDSPQCIAAASKGPEECLAIVAALPPLHRQALTYLISFLRKVAAPENQAVTKVCAREGLGGCLLLGWCVVHSFSNLQFLNVVMMWVDDGGQHCDGVLPERAALSIERCHGGDVQFAV